MMAQRSNLRGTGLKATDPRLMENALEIITEDHLRERAIYAELDAIGPEIDEERSTMIESFLTDDLPILLADEDEDLFPLMLRRCAPEDEIDKTINRLQADHQQTKSVLPAVITSLKRWATRKDPSDADILAQFADHRRRHLIVENAIILPIARVRLLRCDLEAIRSSMLRRRGFDAATEVQK